MQYNNSAHCILTVKYFYIHVHVSCYTEKQKSLKKRSSVLEEMSFYFAVPVNFVSSETSSYYIYLTTLSESLINYTISSSTDVLMEGVVSSNQPSGQIILSTEYIVKTPDHAYRNLGLQLYANGPVTLVVVNYKPLKYGEYTAIPYESSNTSSYEYYAVSTGTATDNTDSFGQILLVGNVNSTTVTITPKVNIRMPEEVQSDSPLVPMPAGQPKTFILHALQTLLIRSDKYSEDLTGSKIASNNPLTVVVGHQCGNIPSDTTGCGHLLEQVPPTVSWGKQFLLSPYKNKDVQFYKIVASNDEITTVKHNCVSQSTFNLSSEGDFNTFKTEHGKYCYLEANHPILVTQLFPSTNFDLKGSPEISMIPPLEKFTKATSIFLPKFKLSEIYLNIISKKKVQFYLNNSPLSLTWSNITDLSGNTVGFGTQTSVNINTAHNVTNSENVDFYGMFYGFSEDFNTAFSLTTPGMKLSLCCYY